MQQQMPAAWSGMCFAPLALTPALSARQSAGSRSSVTSPSFAAIQARLAYQTKREKDLIDAQALH
eukprot:2498547-Pleurochrysis_carterae.AAC.1